MAILKTCPRVGFVCGRPRTYPYPPGSQNLTFFQNYIYIYIYIYAVRFRRLAYRVWDILRLSAFQPHF